MMKKVMNLVTLFVLTVLVIKVTSADFLLQSPMRVASSSEQSGNKTAKLQYPATHVTMKLNKVSEHVYYVQGQPGIATDHEGFISNAGVIITDQGVVLFDALGTPSLGEQLLAEIRKVTDKPIVKVVISHYHADHFYGAQVFKDLGAEVIAPRGADQYMQSDMAKNRLAERKKSLKPWVNNNTRLITPDRYIDNETEFTLGGITFKLTPEGKSHSHGDMIMHVAPDNVLFVGDLVYEQRVPFVVTGNSKHWLQTLNTLDFNGVKVLVPGHGAASTQPVNALKATRDYLDFLITTMQKAVDEMIPFDEAYNVDWSRYNKLPAFDGANRKNAYSVYLSLEADSVTEK